MSFFDILKTLLLFSLWGISTIFGDGVKTWLKSFGLSESLAEVAFAIILLLGLGLVHIIVFRRPILTSKWFLEDNSEFTELHGGYLLVGPSEMRLRVDFEVQIRSFISLVLIKIMQKCGACPQIRIQGQLLRHTQVGCEYKTNEILMATELSAVCFEWDQDGSFIPQKSSGTFEISIDDASNTPTRSPAALKPSIEFVSHAAPSSLTQHAIRFLITHLTIYDYSIVGYQYVKG